MCVCDKVIDTLSLITLIWPLNHNSEQENLQAKTCSYASVRQLAERGGFWRAMIQRGQLDSIVVKLRA